MDCLKIDGSRGEGGGQILRTSVTLSCITGTPVRIVNIRRGRKVPGLRAQHLAAIRLLARVCGARVEGLEIGSEVLEFEPGPVQSMDLSQDIGTAGSIPLVLQTLIVPVAAASKRLKLDIMGGTDVSWSPTTDYTRYVLAAAYSRMGINFSVDVKRRGYYPRGGGRISLEVHPSRGVAAVSLTGRPGRIANLFCTYCGYSRDAISRSVQPLLDTLKRGGLQVNTLLSGEEAADKGAAVMVHTQDPASITGSDGLMGREGFPAGISGRLLESPGTDINLSDMLVVPASIAEGTTVYRIGSISKHLETNLYVASKITGCKYGVGRTYDGYEIRISGRSDAGIQ